MLREHAPVVLLQRSINDLLRQVPNIREGTEEGFHQGRIAIRRIREVLAIVGRRYDEKAIDGIETRLRRAARVLGRTRDADVAQRLIQHVESRFQPAPAVLGQLRLMQTAEQLDFRRRAIKVLESLDLAALPAELKQARCARSFRHALSSGWRSVLRAHIAYRAGEVRSAMDRAGGVYFPNRVHAARIAIKQLRYALELARTTRTWQMPHAIRVLKQVQSALGEAHDRELLIARLDERAMTPTADADASAVESFLRAEIRAFHAKYLESRPAVLDVCDACQRAGRGRSVANRWLLVASVAVPSLLLASGTASASAKREKVVQRRIRVTVA